MKRKESQLKITIGTQYFISTFLLFVFISILYGVQNYIGYETVSLILLLIIFLLPIFNFERGPIILAAIISALAWDYYFIPPHFTLHIDSTEDGVMLFLFFIVALTNGILTSRLKLQKKEALEKDRRLNALLELLKELAAAKDLETAIHGIVQQIYKVFECGSVVFQRGSDDKLDRTYHPASNFVPDELEWLAAETAFRTKTKLAGQRIQYQMPNVFFYPLLLKIQYFL